MTAYGRTYTSTNKSTYACTYGQRTAPRTATPSPEVLKTHPPTHSSHNPSKPKNQETQGGWVLT